MEVQVARHLLGQSATRTMTGDTPDDIKAQLHAEMIEESRRIKTNMAVIPSHIQLAPTGVQIEHVFAWESGPEVTTEAYPLDVEPYSEEEGVFVGISTSIPLWPTGVDIRMCVNGLDRDTIVRQCESLFNNRLGDMPSSLVELLRMLDMPVHMRLAMPGDGEDVLQISAHVAALVGDVDFSGNPTALQDMLNVLSDDEE